MRVAFIVEHPRADVYSGGRYHAWLVACGFCELGHDVTMFTQRLPPFYDDLRQWYPMPVVVRASRLDALVADDEFDLVIGYPILASEWAMAFAKKMGVPCWNFVLDAWPLVSKFAPAVAKRMHFGESHTRALAGSDLLLSISEYAVPFIKKWTGNENVVPLIGCVNSRCADSVYTEWDNRFVSITRLTEHKRFNDLLYVVQHTGVYLDVITSFDASAMMDRIAARLMPEFVTVYSAPDDAKKFEIIKRARALIGGSVYEGLGMPFMEAMYCGVPVVCYDYPVLREVCGDAALYAPPASPAALSGRVMELVKDDYTFADLCVQARFVGKAYGFESMCDRIAGLLGDWF